MVTEKVKIHSADLNQVQASVKELHAQSASLMLTPGPIVRFSHRSR